MTVEEILELLRERRDDYAKPGGYDTAEYYARCEAKVDVLNDVLDTIEYRMRNKS